MAAATKSIRISTHVSSLSAEMSTPRAARGLPIAKQQTEFGQGAAGLDLVDAKRDINDQDRNHERPDEQFELGTQQSQVALRPARMDCRQRLRQAVGAKKEQNRKMNSGP